MQQLQQLMHKNILAILAGMALALSFSVTTPARADISMPDVAKPKGEKCVAPTAEMRASHFEKILHQRDQTVHKGVRTKTFSLKECINCHVPENTTVRFSDDNHFCSACHIQAAVTIDCFQCHADRPGIVPASHKPAAVSTDVNANAPAAANATAVSTKAATTGAAP